MEAIVGILLVILAALEIVFITRVAARNLPRTEGR